MFVVKLCQGNYEVTNNNGRMTATRNGERWPAADVALLGDGLSLALMHRIETLTTALQGVVASSLPTATPRTPRGFEECLAACHKLAQQSLDALT